MTLRGSTGLSGIHRDLGWSQDPLGVPQGTLEATTTLRDL